MLALRGGHHLLGLGGDRQESGGHPGIGQSARSIRQAHRAIGAIVEDPTERDWLKTRLALLVGVSAPGVGAPAERSESFAAWRRFLEAIAADRPLVLVFEDVHWAGATLLEFVEHSWTGRPASRSWSSARRGRNSSSVIRDGRRQAGLHDHFALPALSGRDSPVDRRAPLRGSAPRGDPERATRASGNPLYAEEFARMLTDRGMLERRGQTMQLAAGADIPVPETVQAVIAARLDTLSPSGRRSSTTPPSWAESSGWARWLHERARRARGGARPPHGRQEGAHASRSRLVGQGSGRVTLRAPAHPRRRLSADPPAARVRKHRAAAAWIERLAGDRVTDHAEILAHHYGQALQLAKAAGLDDDMRELEAQAGAS